MSKQGGLAEYVEAVVEDFAERIDPGEKHYKTLADLGELQVDLVEHIEGCVADWEIEQREKYQAEVRQ